mmetsp:Transcript_1655/g.3636  ORF Transcript_1655/g.3636 Transcript_1655/m.3636 type:complete len:280 (+) Transcript_1655:174-1013(+)
MKDKKILVHDAFFQYLSTTSENGRSRRRQRPSPPRGRLLQFLLQYPCVPCLPLHDVAEPLHPQPLLIQHLEQCHLVLLPQRGQSCPGAPPRLQGRPPRPPRPGLAPSPLLEFGQGRAHDVGLPRYLPKAPPRLLLGSLGRLAHAPSDLNLAHHLQQPSPERLLLGVRVLYGVVGRPRRLFQELQRFPQLPRVARQGVRLLLLRHDAGVKRRRADERDGAQFPGIRVARQRLVPNLVAHVGRLRHGQVALDAVLGREGVVQDGGERAQGAGLVVARQRRI